MNSTKHKTNEIERKYCFGSASINVWKVYSGFTTTQIPPLCSVEVSVLNNKNKLYIKHLFYLLLAFITKYNRKQRRQL